MEKVRRMKKTKRRSCLTSDEFVFLGTHQHLMIKLIFPTKLAIFGVSLISWTYPNSAERL